VLLGELGGVVAVIRFVDGFRLDVDQLIPRYPNRSDSPPKLVRRQETFDTYDEAKERRDEINPKIARGQSPAAQRNAGNRPLSHYAQAGSTAWSVRSSRACWPTTAPTIGATLQSRWATRPLHRSPLLTFARSAQR
jgi:hypothetical protein